MDADRPVRQFRRTWWNLGLLAALLVGGAGCASGSKQASEDPALPRSEISEQNKDLARGALEAVEIHGQPIRTVEETVESVFTDRGLRVVRRDTNLIVFERPGERSERAAYGNWFGGDMVVRVHVEFYPQGRLNHFLRSRCFVVREGGSFSEDVQPLSRRKVKEYADLLNEVAGRLN